MKAFYLGGNELVELHSQKKKIVFHLCIHTLSLFLDFSESMAVWKTTVIMEMFFVFISVELPSLSIKAIAGLGC